MDCQDLLTIEASGTYNNDMRMRDEIELLGNENIKQREIIRSLETKISDLEKPGRFYAGQFHYLDGNPENKSWANLSLVCPRCRADILLSRFSPEEIWSLKATGYSNAKIGRLLGLSRERVRQICKKYEEQRAKTETLAKHDADELAKKAEYIENGLTDFLGTLKRRAGRRTKRKRITAEIEKLEAKEAQNERFNKAERQK